MSIHHVYLIPGFFGFANLGDLPYFAHVRAVLAATFARRGLEVEIHTVPTLPTASLPRRTARLVECIADNGGGDAEHLHLVGHSTGGLDARLMVSPGVSLPTAHAVEPLAKKVRSVACVASPHLGAPQAAFFTSVLGNELLRVLSLATVHLIRIGTLPLPAIVALAGTLPGAGRVRSPLPAVLDQVYRTLLADFDATRRAEIEQFFAESGADQSLLLQLTPESMAVFNAAVHPRPGVKYGSVVTLGRPPSWTGAREIGVSPNGQAAYALYRGLYRLAEKLDPMLLAPLTEAHKQALLDSYGALPTAADNDAIVPSRSQIYGDIIAAVTCDHHDIIGHFSDRSVEPPHIDWLATRSGFSRTKFENVWGKIAEAAIMSAS